MYEDVLVVHINASDNEQLPEKTEKIPVPGRENQYIASIDVFHQLHCLVSSVVVSHPLSKCSKSLNYVPGCNSQAILSAPVQHLHGNARWSDVGL